MGRVYYIEKYRAPVLERQEVPSQMRRARRRLAMAGALLFVAACVVAALFIHQGGIR